MRPTLFILYSKDTVWKVTTNNKALNVSTSTVEFGFKLNETITVI